MGVSDYTIYKNMRKKMYEIMGFILRQSDESKQTEEQSHLNERFH